MSYQVVLISDKARQPCLRPLHQTRILSNNLLIEPASA